MGSASIFLVAFMKMFTELENKLAYKFLLIVSYAGLAFWTVVTTLTLSATAAF